MFAPQLNTCALACKLFHCLPCWVSQTSDPPRVKDGATGLRHPRPVCLWLTGRPAGQAVTNHDKDMWVPCVAVSRTLLRLGTLGRGIARVGLNPAGCAVWTPRSPSGQYSTPARISGGPFDYICRAADGKPRLVHVRRGNIPSAAACGAPGCLPCWRQGSLPSPGSLVVRCAPSLPTSPSLVHSG